MRKAVIIGLLLGAVGAHPAHAQSKVGTTIGGFLGIEPSARIAGMGNAGVALFEGIQSVYYNPAALGSVEEPAIQFSHILWFADIGLEYAAAALPVPGWGIFFGSVTALNSGDIDVRTVEQPLGTGEQYSVNNLALGLGFGRRFTQRFGAGIQLNYLNESIWHSSFNAFTLSVGTTYRLTEGGMKLGASLSNFGMDGQFGGRDLAVQIDRDPDRFGDNSALPGDQFTGEFPVPILFRVGLSLPQELNQDSRVVLALDAYHPNDNSESVSLGTEWSWRETLALRAGYQQLFQEDSELGLTLGVGLRAGIGERAFQFDYAWADHERLKETHRMTLSVSF